MPFQDVIDNYALGTTGQLTGADGDVVNYRITSGTETATVPNTDQGARVFTASETGVEVTFERFVVGVTLSFDRSNAGEVYFVEINGTRVDLAELIARGDAEFTTITAGSGTSPAVGTHVIADGGVSSTGSFDNSSLGFLKFNIPVQTVAVTGSGAGGGFDIVEIGIDSIDFMVVCFAGDTEIQTPTGPRKVDDLKAGDAVCTGGGQTRTIIATNARRVVPLELFRETRMLPVRIKAGALGGGLPHRDLLVSRQHRLLVASRIAQRICAHEEVLIPAFRLVGLPGIEVDRSMVPITYHHILLETHDVLIANGALAESLFVGSMSHKAMLDEVDDSATEVIVDDSPLDMKPARYFPTADEARKIVAAHARHQRPLLEARFCPAD